MAEMIDENVARSSSKEDRGSQKDSNSPPLPTEGERNSLDGQGAAIYDVANECLSFFEHISTTQSKALTTEQFLVDDPTSEPSTNPSNRTRDFLGLRHSFAFWVDYTGALSLMESSLDARLQGLADVSSMVIELLDMVLRNLQRRKIYAAPFLFF